jgi:hypothetical protein
MNIDAEQAIDGIAVLLEASPSAIPALTTNTSSGPLSRTRLITASRSALSACTAVLPVSAASRSAASGEPE